MSPFREWPLSDRYEQQWVGVWVEPVTLTALLAGGAYAREVSLGSTEWPTQFNDARPTGDDLHPYKTRGAATFLPLIVEHRPHTRSGRI